MTARGRRERLSRRSFLGAAASVAVPALSCSRRPSSDGRRHAAFWFSYGGRNREVLEALVARFNGSQDRYAIDAVFQGDYFEALAKLRTAIYAGVAPALSHVVGEVIPYLSEAGVLEPLDDYPGARDLGVVPALGQAGSWIAGDRRPLVALPFNRSTPIAYLNGDLFAREGLAPPRTWDDLRRTARRLTVRDGNHTVRHGFGCPISWWFWVALVGQAGGEVVTPAGDAALGGAAGAAAIRFWQTLVHEDRSMKPPPGRDYNAWEATNQDYLAGRAAMIWTSTAFLKYLEDNAPFRVVAAPLPARQQASVPTGGTHFVMLREAPAEEKRAAWSFLRWMLEPEQVIEWSTRTGYMPVTTAAVSALEKTGYYAAHPNDRVAVDQLAVATPWPWSPKLFRIQQEIVQPMLEGAVLRDTPADAAIESARALLRRELG